jgi:hypothetical protein
MPRVLVGKPKTGKRFSIKNPGREESSKPGGSAETRAILNA